jgi:hypothetical protein
MATIGRACGRAARQPIHVSISHARTYTRRNLLLCTSLRFPEARAPRLPVFQACRLVSAEATARDLSQRGVDEALQDYDEEPAAEARDKQHQRPWMREGADHAPVRRQRSAGAMTKGCNNLPAPAQPKTDIP